MKKYESYKDSGIEWIGEIPMDWKVTKLKFIGDAIGGLTYAPNNVVENADEGVLVLRSSNIQNGKLSLKDNVFVNLEISDKLTLKKGDILICSRNGSQHLIGKNICIDERTEGSTFGAFMMIFRSKYYGFLNQYFNSPIFTSQSGLFLTATINQLTSGTLNNFYIAIPESIEEQTQIANFLDHKTTQINTLISKKEQFISLLQEERIAIINQAVTKGLDPKVKMKDSGVAWLGEIPEHWEVKRIKYIGKIISGYSFKSDDFTRKGIRVMKISNIQTMRVDWTDDSYLPEEFLTEYEKFKINKGDLVFALTRPIISTGIKATIVTEQEDVLLNQRNAVLKPSEKLYVRWMYYMIFNEKFKEHFESLIDGTGQQPNISSNDIANIHIPLPNFEEQNEIVSLLDFKTEEIEIIITKTQQEIELLKEYKTALISEVVTGKVDVRDLVN